MEHRLKTWVEYFDDVAEDRKPFEVRIDDRPYQIGDTLILEEYSAAVGFYTGAVAKKEITYILGRNEDEKTFVKDGYVILGLKPIPDNNYEKLQQINKELIEALGFAVLKLKEYAGIDECCHTEGIGTFVKPQEFIKEAVEVANKALTKAKEVTL